MNDRPKNRMTDAGMAALFGLAVIVVGFIPPLGVLLFPGLLPTLIFFPHGNSQQPRRVVHSGPSHPQLSDLERAGLRPDSPLSKVPPTVINIATA
jgi:hypothetical protein